MEPLQLLSFFFQAEDGIRDWSVTGVQTCALPISQRSAHLAANRCRQQQRRAERRNCRLVAGGRRRGCKVMSDWKRGVSGKSGDFGGGGFIKKKKTNNPFTWTLLPGTSRESTTKEL